MNLIWSRHDVVKTSFSGDNHRGRGDAHDRRGHGRDHGRGSGDAISSYPHRANTARH